MQTIPDQSETCLYFSPLSLLGPVGSVDGFSCFPSSIMSLTAHPEVWLQTCWGNFEQWVVRLSSFEVRQAPIESPLSHPDV